MSSLRQLIKQNARRALQGNWGQALAITLLIMGATLLLAALETLVGDLMQIPHYIDYAATPALLLDDLPAYTPAALVLVSASALLYLFLLAPLRLGVMGWFYRLGGGRAEEVSSVFEFFGTVRLFCKAVLLWLSVTVRALLWVVLFTLPATAVLVFAEAASRTARSDSEALLASGAAACGGMLALVTVLLVAIWLQRYALAPYALVDEPDRPVRLAIRRSIRCTKGHRLELLWLEITLLGWRLLGLLYVTQLYTLPYIESVRGLYARYLIELNERVGVEAALHAVELNAGREAPPAPQEGEDGL